MKRRVVIVGGGLAGLSAAECLARNRQGDYEITLVEAKRVVGGRAGSFSDPNSDQTVDYCQHVAMGCCTNFLGFIQRCGIEHQFRRFRELTFLHPDREASRFVPSSWLPAPLHLASAISGLKFLKPSQRREIKRAILRLMRTPSQELRQSRAGQWLQNHRQSDEVIERFWNVILVSALGESTELVSMAAAKKVIIDGFAAARSASDVLVPTKPLSELFGVKVRDELQNLGVQFQCSQAVQSIDDSASIKLIDGTTIQADHVILAISWQPAIRLLKSMTRRGLNHEVDAEALRQITGSPISGIHLWFDREITELDHAVMVGTISQWLFRDPIRRGRPSSNNERDSEHYYQVVISASESAKRRSARRLGREELVSQVLEELAHAFPRSRDANLIRHKLVTDPKSVFSISPAIDAVRPPTRTALPWLHLAGDWIQTDWPATMEGAVISGRMAAGSIMTSEGNPPILNNERVHPGLSKGWLARLLIT